MSSGARRELGSVETLGAQGEWSERSGMEVMLIAAPEPSEITPMGQSRFLHGRSNNTLRKTTPDGRAAVWLGIMRVFVGLVVVIIQIVSTVAHRGGDYDVVDSTGAGIWCGIVFSVAGILSLAAAINPKKSTVIAHMGASLVSAVFALVLAGLCAVASFYLVHYILLSLAVLELFADLIAAGSTIWLLYNWKTKGPGHTIHI